ncbi:DegT/DnrJ/EryC1/StrS family aminotransferase [Gemmatimonas sp.]|uniref:DegT/DnrJ/EryC1/StrS family aminotransferase n=1 Tax=Gemmatimonas sp. TaxID=1962908 RepID=UPI0037BF4DBF
MGPEEIAEGVAALPSDWITTGPRTQRFAHAFAQSVGAPAALALIEDAAHACPRRPPPHPNLAVAATR